MNTNSELNINESVNLLDLPKIVTDSDNIRICIRSTFLVPAHLGSPGKRAIKRVNSIMVNDHYDIMVNNNEY